MDAVATQTLSIRRSSAPAWAGGYALLWGGFTTINPWLVPQFFPSQSAVIGTVLFGLFTVGLGVAAYKRKLWAVWWLFAFAVLDAAIRVITGAHGYMMPGMLLMFSWSAARALRKEALLR